MSFKFFGKHLDKLKNLGKVQSMITHTKLKSSNKVIARALGYTHVLKTKKGSWGSGTPFRDFERYFKPHNRKATDIAIDGLNSDSTIYYSWAGVIKLFRLVGDTDNVINPFQDVDYYFSRAVGLLRAKTRKVNKKFIEVDKRQNLGII